MLKVIKRDGRKVDFDKSYISTAISKAIADVKRNSKELGQINQEDLNFAVDIANKIESSLVKNNIDQIHIEDIQDMVERKLMNSKRKDVAISYIRYRQYKAEKRYQAEQLDMKIQGLIDMTSDRVRENANKDANVWATKRDILAGIVARDYAIRKILPQEISKAHEEGIIHWHDMDYSPFFNMYNCMLIDFKGMLENGFVMGNADIEPPKGINTATALVSQIVANVSSNIYGGTSFNRADEVLEPYAKLTYEKHLKEAKKFVVEQEQENYAKDQTIKSIYDSIQSLEYELNTLYSSNGQTPFVTLGFGLGTSWFSREIQKAILKIRIEGLGKSKKTPVFPKLIFCLKKGLNLNSEDPNYDIKQLALKCSCKRMYPDIVNYDKIVEITGDFKFPMGCRSFLSSYKNEKGEYVTDGRMNVGVVSLNLVRIALETNSVEEYMSLLNNRLELCKEALIFRIHTLDYVKAKNAPILYMYGATGFRLKPEDSVKGIFKNGYASVSLGYIGLHEVATKFFGHDWQENPEAKQFTLDIMKKLKDSVDSWKDETDYAFSIYATPSEGLCDRFCRIDKNNFGVIDHITDKDYYTNSFHYDVEKKITPFEKINFEKDYIKYTNGGFIDYAEFPSLVKNPKALEAYWDFCYDKVPYIGTNTPVDKCYVCGFEGEFGATEDGFRCPNCGNSDPRKSSCVRRICGYLGDVIMRKPNHGKLTEMQHRVKHM